MHIIAISNAATTIDRLGQIPLAFWLRLGAGIAIVVGTVVFLRKIAHVNKAVLTVVAGLCISIVGFNWVYERNEPSWASPTVQFLAGFFPSKGKVEQKKSGL